MTFELGSSFKVFRSSPTQPGRTVNVNNRKTDLSEQHLDRARRSLAGGVSSAARLSLMPFFAESGAGARLRDVDGNEYIDYVLAYGPLVLGHAPAPVIEAVRAQAARGTMFGLGLEAEYLLAEELVGLMPCCDLVRFANSGTEALHFVMRLARAYTGRPKIIKFEGHYHGWLDDQYVSVKPGPEAAAGQGALETPGQPADAAENLIILPWNDLAVVEEVLAARAAEAAAVILEPVPFYHGAIPPEEGYLAGLRRLTEKYGVLLIFDEVVTGFRLALGGAQEYFGVTPDLCVMAKGFAAGLPLAALGGRRAIMDLIADNTVPHMGTYNGNALAVAGALAAIRELKKGQRRGDRADAPERPAARHRPDQPFRGRRRAPGRQRLRVHLQRHLAPAQAQVIPGRPGNRSPGHQRLAPGHARPRRPVHGPGHLHAQRGPHRG